ncbi:hypothetical protein QR680_001205 [Steinernema hermaphroditum]|uniref:WAP domain-containing protein n=1 Tax=Steinernema hermaphroditum TaxID=289476 RepID=A0AA39GXB8_9BILA|nr:hypothetical protein QR680_001205 [Steinernema hermaphroditum]
MLFKLFFLSLLFCAGNFEEVPNEESDLCSNGNRPFQFENGTALQCADDNDENCGPPFECDRSTKYCCPRMMISEPILNFTYFESEDDHEKFCGVEGRLVKENGSRLVNCELDSECLPPSVCHSSGFCCLIALHQEPPPVGCPMGTRPLRTANGTELSCNPNIADSCPGGAICHEDSLDGFRRCCGRDPGEGCPSGSRVVKNANGKPTLCSPGSYEHGCKNMAICQWSFLIDRYQCCEPDNGCAAMQSPLKDSKGEVIPCSKSAPCPNGGTCRFNFWTAGYQCCALNTIDLCPAGEVPFLIESSGEVYTCSATDPCPDGYFCSNGNVCCGRPGSCPAGKSIVADANGRISVCSIRASATCPGGSTCEASSAVGQRLCCSQNVYSCPAPGLPYPSASSPQQCSPFDPYSCPLPSQCLPSNVPGLNICCNDGQQHNNLCPAGWKANDFSVQYCNPQITASCPGFASCLRSPIAQQFVCCVPGYDDDTVGEISCANRLAKAERRAGRVRVCRSRNDRCSEGYSCQPGGPLSGGKMLCCSAALASLDDAPPFRCPHPSQIPVTRPENPSENVFCEYPGQKGVCPIDAACQSAANSAGLMICCYGSPNIPTCPFPRTPQPSPVGYVPCDMMRPNECWSGYTCVRSASGYRSSLCCSLKEVPNPTCPNQQSLSFESGRPQYCNPIIPDNCPDDYICVNALGQNDVFVCCSSPSATICPRDYSPSRDNYGNVTPAALSPKIIQIDSSAVKVQPFLEHVQMVKTASQTYMVELKRVLGLVSPAVDLDTPASFLQRCRRGFAVAMINRWLYVPMVGRLTIRYLVGTTYECNPLTFGDCPVKYECAYSNVRGISVCCKQAIPTIVPTIVPPVALTCPRVGPNWDDEPKCFDGSQPLSTGSIIRQCSIIGEYLCVAFLVSLTRSLPRYLHMRMSNPRAVYDEQLRCRLKAECSVHRRWTVTQDSNVPRRRHPMRVFVVKQFRK